MVSRGCVLSAITNFGAMPCSHIFFVPAFGSLSLGVGIAVSTLDSLPQPDRGFRARAWCLFFRGCSTQRALLRPPKRGGRYRNGRRRGRHNLLFMLMLFNTTRTHSGFSSFQLLFKHNGQRATFRTSCCCSTQRARARAPPHLRAPKHGSHTGASAAAREASIGSQMQPRTLETIHRVDRHRELTRELTREFTIELTRELTLS